MVAAAVIVVSGSGGLSPLTQLGGLSLLQRAVLTAQRAGATTCYVCLEQEQEDLKHDQEIKQQKIYTYGGGIGFILMMVVAGVSLRAFKNKQKANEIISYQKELVEEKQKEIIE